MNAPPFLLSLACLGLCLAIGQGCYEPTTPAGLACTLSGQCPSGQSCGSDLICRGPGDEPEIDFDAGTTPGLPDAAPCAPEACAGPCGAWSCEDGECQVNEGACGEDQTCNPATFVCDQNAECTPDDVDTDVCNECGQKRCQADGSWGDCEAYDACGTDESCEPHQGGFRCESTLACVPATLLSQNGCGSCGDLFCKHDGSGTQCQQDPSECPGGTCTSNGVHWNCIVTPVCSASISFSCGGNTQWCYENSPTGPDCRTCTSGFFNCDGLAGCESSTPC